MKTSIFLAILFFLLFQISSCGLKKPLTLEDNEADNLLKDTIL